MNDSVVPFNNVVFPAESFGVTETVVVSSAFAEAEVADQENVEGAPATVQTTFVESASASGN